MELITNSVNSIISNLVASNDINNITSISPSIGFQISSTNPESLDFTQRIAKANNLSLVNFSECQSKLLKYYNIPSNKSLIFTKIDLGIGSDSPSVSFKVFNPVDKKELNMSICDGSTIKYSIPVSSAVLNTSLINLFLIKGINISSENDPFFNSMCNDYQSVIENITQSSKFYTLNGRKNTFLQTNTPKCMIGSTSCEVGLLNDNYTTCICKQNSTNTQASILKFEKIFFKTIIDSNYNVLWCLNRISKFTSNFIFYGFIAVNSTFLILSIFTYFRRNKFIEKNYELIRKNEKFFQKKGENKEMKEIEKNFKIQLHPSSTGSPPIKKKSSELRLIKSTNKRFNKNNFINTTLVRKPIPHNFTFQSPYSIGKFFLNSKFDAKTFQKIDVTDLSIFEIESLSYKAQLKFDNRKFIQYFKDCLVLDNLIIRTFLLKSIYFPSFIRYLILMNTINLNLITICLLYNLTLIDRTTTPTRQELIYMTVSAAAWSSIISGLINFMINFMIYVPESIRSKLNESFLTRNSQVLIENYAEFISKMKFRYICFIMSYLVLALSAFYFVIIFLVIYNNLIIDIFTKLGVSIMINFLIGTSIPLKISLIRLLSYIKPKYKYLMTIKIIEFWVLR